eukprot:scaffold1803_cov92-Amphora_coffeaeformis.AAC.17
MALPRARTHKNKTSRQRFLPFSHPRRFLRGITQNNLRLVFFVTLLILLLQFVIRFPFISTDFNVVLAQYQTSIESLTKEPCALVFFGLPRSFQSLVYPSIVKHVLQPNAKYQCDIFVHYYNLTFEQAGRSGDGGTLDPHQVRLLKRAVSQTTNTNTTVAFTVTQEANFWTQYKDLLDKMRTVKGPDGNLRYHPWKEKSYHMTQAANVIKMWHSIQEGFRLMERHAAAQQTGDGSRTAYTRVAILRSDVFYMTPIDIWETGTLGTLDRRNRVAVVPNFANFPVNDRMIYGPYGAVRIWATTRFETIEEHAQWTLQHKPGYAMHSETFVEGLLDRIENEGYQVNKHETICFFRVRADETIWVNDCSYPPPFTGETVLRGLPTDMKDGVEAVLGRSCLGDVFQVAPESRAEALHCPLNGMPKTDD